jgi:hypothetical protein
MLNVLLGPSSIELYVYTLTSIIRNVVFSFGWRLYRADKQRNHLYPHATAAQSAILVIFCLV